MDPTVLARVNDRLAAGPGSAAVNPAGDLLVGRAGGDGFVLDLSTGERRAAFPAQSPLNPAPAADGTAFVAYDGEAVQVRDLPGGDPVAAFPADLVARNAAGRDPLAPGGTHVYLAALPRPDWARYDAATGEREHAYAAVENDETADCFALSADGSRVAVAGGKSPVAAGFVAFYDAASGGLASHGELAYEADAVALSPDGSAAVLVDGIGGLVGGGWRVTEDAPVADARFVRRGVVSVTRAGTLTLRDAATGDRLATHPTDAPASGLSADAAGDLVALSGEQPRLVVPAWAD